MAENSEHFNNFRIEKLTEKNVSDVSFLFKVVFGANASEKAIIDKHKSCSGKNKFIGFIAYDIESGTPVAHFAVYPRLFRSKNEEVLGAQSGDTMANPNFKKKRGLIAQLAKRTFEYCKKCDIQIITGFPNTHSYMVFIKKLKFQDLPRFSQLTFLENKFEFHRFSKRSKRLRNIHTSYIKFILNLLTKKGTPFQNANSNTTNLTYVNHDDIYFKWKNQSDKKLIKIFGTNVLIKFSHELNQLEIGDIDYASNPNIKKVLLRLKFITRITGLRFLNFAASKNAFTYKKLKPFLSKKNQSSIFVAKNLDSNIDINSLSLLTCDSDGF